MSGMDETAIQQIVLERLKVGLQHRVGRHMLESMRPEFVVDHLSGDLTARLEAYVLAEKLPPVELTGREFLTFMSPASPFQHWKRKHEAAWWLAWFVRRWPVREDATTRTVTMTVDLTRYRSYPEADYAVMDGFGVPVLTHTVSTRWQGVDGER